MEKPTSHAKSLGINNSHPTPEGKERVWWFMFRGTIGTGKCLSDQQTLFA